MINNDMSFAYIFHFNGNKKYYYTSYESNFIHKIEDYHARFDSQYNINIKTSFFDDSNQNYIILIGQNDHNYNNFIKKIELSTKVEIFLYFHNKKILKLWKTYLISKIHQYDLKFEIFLEPLSKSLDKNFIESFSKNCRANFGDSRCNVNKNAYMLKLSVKEIQGNKIFIYEKIDNNFYQNGEAYFKKSLKMKIISNGENYLIVSKIQEFKNHIYVIPSCDKSLNNCVEKYNNAVNFRGEPFVPVTNMLKMQ